MLFRSIENGTVTAHFGDKGTPTRSMSRAVATNIPVMEAPYTTEFISDKKMTATEVKNGWDLGAGFGWFEYANLPVFKEQERWFKIPNGTFSGGLTTTGSSGGAQAVKVIVPQGSTWVIENSNQFSKIGRAHV